MGGVVDFVSEKTTDVFKATGLASVGNVAVDFASAIWQAGSDLTTKAFDALGLKDLNALLGIPEPPKDQGYQVQRQSDTNAKLPIVCGTVKLGGTVIQDYVSSNYKTYHQLIALCIKDATNFANVLSISVAGQKDDDAGYVWLSSGLVSGTRFHGKIDIVVFDSTNDNVTTFRDSIIAKGMSGIDTSMTWKDMVVVYAKYTYDREVWQGQPTLEFIVSSGNSNPVSNVLKYLKDTRYGAGLTDDQLDLTSFTTAISQCDETITG